MLKNNHHFIFNLKFLLEMAMANHLKKTKQNKTKQKKKKKG